MKYRYFAVSLAAFWILAGAVQADDLQNSVKEAVARMKQELNLTDEQAAAIKPIIKASAQQRQAFLEGEGNMFANKKMVKAMMLKFREEEDQQLSKVLSGEQMAKMLEKRRLRQGLNKDQVDFSDALGANSVNMDGATMAF